MGFWNRAGRWLASAVGLLFVLIGFNALWHGLDIIQVERGWTGVIAGTIAMSTGVVMILLTLLIDRVEALRLAMLTQRALQVAEAVPVPVDLAMAATDEDVEPPKPIEVPVEPPPMAPATSAPGAFSFRTFGKRPKPAVEPPPEAAAERPIPEPVPVAEPEQPPEQIRRFAPPQFRRPSAVPPPPPHPAEEPEAPGMAPEPVSQTIPEPEVPPVAAQVLDIVVTETTISVEASITEAIAEELRLPRASNLPPVVPMETAQEPDQQAPALQVSEEPAGPPRGAAQTHAWLEKALSGEDSEPGLDWLRQRRTGEDRPARSMPSFMRRHVEGDEAEAAAAEEPDTVAAEPPASDQSIEANPAQEPERAAVVGRYAANGSDYTLYADGSIDAKTPEGPRHFSSMDELRGFLQRQNETAES